jgi:hypothetical protein
MKGIGFVLILLKAVFASQWVYTGGMRLEPKQLSKMFGASASPSSA